MNATIQLTQIGTEDTASVIGPRNALITLLHRAFAEVPMFKSICTEALLTFDTEAAQHVKFSEENIAHKDIKQYEVVEVFNSSTGEEGLRIVGIWGDAEKNEGSRIGPVFDIDDHDGAEKLIMELIEKYGLPVHIETIIAHFTLNDDSEK